MAEEISSKGRSVRTFIDTNILVYSDDSRDPAKQEKALALIKKHFLERTGVLSLQVLQEYFVTVVRKLKLDAELAKRRVEFFAKFYVADPRVSDVLAAIDLHRLHGFSYWDSLVLHTAKQAGCRVLLSEDLQHGQEINVVRIVNPFL